MRNSWFAFVVVGSAIGSAGVLSTRAYADMLLPALKTHVPRLSQPVEVLRDRWGISHIYAQNERDLFFAQGYIAARDRLFQFELWRRQAMGTTAEIFGRRELQRDIGARLHSFRGNLSRELNSYHPRGEAIVTAFVDGVNAYIAATERDPALLPLEFRLLDIRPGRWTPAVVISRHQALVTNVKEEVMIAKAVSRLGVEQVRRLGYFQGGEAMLRDRSAAERNMISAAGDPLLSPDPALDLAALPDDVLALYDVFRGPLRFTPDQIVLKHRNDPAAFAKLTAFSGSSALEMLAQAREIGSNSWVVAGSRTQSTFPLLANDPHRTLSAPSLRYWVHLVAPGWNVIGGGEPVLPGVSIGHNEHGAWGLTIFGGDSEDLYVYDTNPAVPQQYRYRGRWEGMRIVKDTIAVKGEAPVKVEYKFTRHGPVLFEDHARHKAYALRAAWLEAGGAPYLASLRMNQARTWQEFREACTHNRIPSESMVWADRKGNIGFQAAGSAPLRPNWSGLLPVPGDGRYEWDGFIPIESLPHELNPARGYIVTANQYLMPNDYRWPQARHYAWGEPFRAARIHEVLSSGRVFSVAETARLQNDHLSIPARSLVPLLEGLELRNSLAAKARDLLLEWDFILHEHSVAAGIYEMWQRRLQQNIRKQILPEGVGFPILMKRSIDLLLAPGGEFGADPIGGRDEILARSLDEAVAELEKRFGPQIDAWEYGREGYHHALIQPLLADAVAPELRARLNIGPAPRGGDSFTVTATGSSDRQKSGGSFKIIVDTEDWDNSIGQNTPGQSGDPDSPHYRDLFNMWSQGKYFPVAFSRQKVESVAEERLLLQPGTD